MLKDNLFHLRMLLTILKIISNRSYNVLEEVTNIPYLLNYVHIHVNLLVLNNMHGIGKDMYNIY